MDKYKKLITNTLLFALSSFGSKVLVYLMMPLYTGILTPDGYGIITNIQDTSQLLLPLTCVGIANAIIRFGLDAACDKKAVFTGGFAALGIGTALVALLYPLLHAEPALSGYLWLVYLYVTVSCARNLCSQFVRARQMTRLYALDGVLNTTLLVVCYVVYLIPCKLGIVGYVLALGYFFFMNIGNARIAEDSSADATRAKFMAQGGMLLRYLVIFLVLLVCVKTGFCEPFSMVIPVALLHPILLVYEFFTKEAHK